MYVPFMKLFTDHIEPNYGCNEVGLSWHDRFVFSWKFKGSSTGPICLDDRHGVQFLALHDEFAE
jgi:hypothetical protein